MVCVSTLDFFGTLLNSPRCVVPVDSIETFFVEIPLSGVMLEDASECLDTIEALSTYSLDSTHVNK